MRVALLMLRQIACMTAFAVMGAAALAKVPSPTRIALEGGRLVQHEGKRLSTVDPATGNVSVIQLPAALNRAFTNSSSIGFPSDRSRLIEGNEYILIVVNQASSSNPSGYCGAGEEGTLYALELRDSAAVPRLALPVQSCLKDFDLATDSNQRSEYLAISWQDEPIGIHVHWDVYGDQSDVSRFYRYEAGQFVQAIQRAR